VIEGRDGDFPLPVEVSEQRSFDHSGVVGELVHGETFGPSFGAEFRRHGVVELISNGYHTIQSSTPSVSIGSQIDSFPH